MRSDQNYLVFCVDFGMQVICSSSRILALPKMLSIEKIPAQGLKCIVDNYKNFPKFRQMIEKLFDANALIAFKTLNCYGEGTYRIEIIGLVDANGKSFDEWC